MGRLNSGGGGGTPCDASSSSKRHGRSRSSDRYSSSDRPSSGDGNGNDGNSTSDCMPAIVRGFAFLESREQFMTGREGSNQLGQAEALRDFSWDVMLRQVVYCQ